MGNKNQYLEEQTTYWPQKKDKRTNNDLQSIAHRIKDRVTRTKLEIAGELRCYGRVASSCSSSGIRRKTLVTQMFRKSAVSCVSIHDTLSYV